MGTASDNTPLGRDTVYRPMLGNNRTVSDSFHGADVFDDEDEDDAPPLDMLQMGGQRGGRYRGLSVGNTGMSWPNNSADLDKFLTQIYAYFVGKGLWTIILAKLFNLLVIGFIVVFTTFLAGCVDYQVMFATYDFYQAVNISRLSQTNAFIIICLVVFALFWFWHVLHVVLSIKGLITVHNFYMRSLGINDSDLPTTRWTDVVSRLLEVQPEDDPSKRLDHQDIANIIMRRENYLIAMFNVGVIRLSIPIYGRWKTPTVLTKSLEWNIDRLMNYIFEDNMIRPQFTNEAAQDELAHSLRWRMRFWGLINLVFSPFIVIMMAMYFIFQYGEEVHRDPGALGARQYTPYARMIFREFNEYPHLFERRLNSSYEKARDYMRLFPYENTALLARFVSFVAGAFAIVLLVLSFIDENILLDMEIIPGHNVLWFIGVFSAIYAGARSLIPAETLVFQPERLMRAVIEGTHHYPPHWHNRLHSDMVRRQFSRLFEYKVVIFLTEIVGVIVAPLVLLFAMPAGADDIIRFVAEHTAKKNKIGYVCSFSLFDIKQHGNPMYGVPAAANSAGPKSMSRFGKMEKSFLNFKANNPDWKPSEDGVAYLDNLNRYQQAAASTSGAAAQGGAGVPNAHDLAESTLFVSSVILNSTHSAPARSTLKGKERASETNDSTNLSTLTGNVNESFVSTNASNMVDTYGYNNQGMMALLESVYSAQESGMV